MSRSPSKLTSPRTGSWWIQNTYVDTEVSPDATISRRVSSHRARGMRLKCSSPVTGSAGFPSISIHRLFRPTLA